MHLKRMPECFNVTYGSVLLFSAKYMQDISSSRADVTWSGDVTWHAKENVDKFQSRRASSATCTTSARQQCSFRQETGQLNCISNNTPPVALNFF